MKRYYLITFSWTAGELSKVEEYKVFTDTKEPLREIVNANVIHRGFCLLEMQEAETEIIRIQRDIDEWISDQVLEILRSECSSTFKCKDGLYRIVVTSDYPEKSKDWRPLRLQNHISKILCDTIIEAERDIRINDILS